LINDDEFFTELKEPADYCVHGTTAKAVNLIMQNGLSRMSRSHIHFAASNKAISGFRTSSEFLIHIDMAKAMADGIQFYKSTNGVILTPGDSDGKLDPKYITHIVQNN
jgi:2'-phosphotransferase